MKGMFGLGAAIGGLLGFGTIVFLRGISQAADSIEASGELILPAGVTGVRIAYVYADEYDSLLTQASGRWDEAFIRGLGIH